MPRAITRDPRVLDPSPLVGRLLRVLQLFAVPALYLGPLPVTVQPLYAQSGMSADLARPGPEHAALAALAGNWMATVTSMSGQPASAPAQVRPVLGGRFLEIDVEGADSLGSTAALILLGFDRRHGVYQVAVMDTYGTYFVTGRGTGEAPTAMAGTDDDPMMKQMGFTKEFVFSLHLEGPDRFRVDIAFVDTRTAARKLMPAGGYLFERRE